MSKPTTWTFLLVDPRTHHTFHVGQIADSPGLLLEQLYAYPRASPGFVDRALFELAMQDLEPRIYALAAHEFDRARHALDRVLHGRRGAVDPIVRCKAMPIDKCPRYWVKSEPLSSDAVSAIHNMRAEGMTPTQIMRKMGIKKSALMHMLSGRRHRKEYNAHHGSRLN